MILEPIKLSGEIFRNIWLKKYPFLLYFKPTARCNLRCKSCNRWQDEASVSEELSLKEISDIFKKFRKAGFSILTLWGGEPTIRKDLPEIFLEAKKLGYRTSMCTNCFLLPRKAKEILPNLDVLLCSLDGYGSAHDEFRGVDGLFNNVVEAIKVAKTFSHLYIKIWASIHKKSVDQVEQLSELAKKLGVGIEFFPISAIKGYNDELVPDKNDLKQAFEKILQLKQSGFPIYNPERVLHIMKEGAPFMCNFGKLAVFVDHKGNVSSCEDSAGNPQQFWCNYREFDPDIIFKSSDFQKVTERLKKCNICSLPCMLELSGSLPRALAEMFFSRGRGVR